LALELIPLLLRKSWALPKTRLKKNWLRRKKKPTSYLMPPGTMPIKWLKKPAEKSRHVVKNSKKSNSAW
jgi:hypothetical protein